MRSSGTPFDKNPLTISALLPSPHNHRSDKVAPSASLIYIACHGPAPLLSSLSEPLISPPRVFNPSACCYKRRPSCNYYTRWCGQFIRRNLQFLADPHLPKWRPELSQNSIVGYSTGYVSPLWFGTSPTRSVDYYASKGWSGLHTCDLS